MKDYNNLKEVIVTSQEEMDDIPFNYTGRIIIKSKSKIYVYRRYNSYVEAWGNSSVEARGNSSVVARGNSSVEAWENSSVEAWGNSSVVAWGNSSVVARENSSVVAQENSSVVAWGNSQILCLQNVFNIITNSNARIVYFPKTLKEFVLYYGLKCENEKVHFYKAVHKKSNKFLSDRDSSFEYIIGEYKEERCDNNINVKCGYGINISTLQFALTYGSDWDDLAIIEVEAREDDIVVPLNSEGKVRASRVKVLREVPLEECGLYGKILSKRRKNNEIFTN